MKKKVSNKEKKKEVNARGMMKREALRAPSGLRGEGIKAVDPLSKYVSVREEAAALTLADGLQAIVAELLSCGTELTLRKLFLISI